MDCSMPGPPVHHQLPELLKLTSIELVMPSTLSSSFKGHPQEKSSLLCFIPSSQGEGLTGSTQVILAAGWPTTSVVSDSFPPMDCSPPASPLHEILQARTLEWVAMPSSRGSFPPRDGNHTLYVSWLASSLLLVPPRFFFTALLTLDVQTPLWVCIFALLLS